MRRVLITAARGFLGRHRLSRLAESRCEVHAVSSVPPVIAKQTCTDLPANVHWHQADLRGPHDAKALIRSVLPIDLLHLAWITTPRLLWDSKENDRWLAVSKQLLREFAACYGQRIVVSGTYAE